MEMAKIKKVKKIEKALKEPSAFQLDMQKIIEQGFNKINIAYEKHLKLMLKEVKKRNA